MAVMLMPKPSFHRVGKGVEQQPPPLSKHQYLTMDKYHRNQKDAENLVLSYLRHAHPGLGDGALKKRILKLARCPEPRDFRSFVEEARGRGACYDLWAITDGQKEHFFPVSMLLEFNEGMKVTSTLLGESVEVVGPGRVGPVEGELAEDILTFRREACEASNFSYAKVARSYRAYILACCALVESFLNRAVHRNRELIKTDPKIKRLSEPCPFDERIALWVEVFGYGPLAELKKTPAWAHYHELRIERNRMLHGVDLSLSVSLPKVAETLNKVREGVGGFMSKLREMQRLSPLPFVQRLQTAPRVKYMAPSIGRK